MADELEILSLHPFVRQVVADKVRGAIIGSALGDCIGLYTEFLNKSMSQTAYPTGRFTLTGTAATSLCRDSHRNKFTEGSWTDDTDHCLLIILSFLHSNGKTPSALDFAKRLRTWIEQGLLCLDRLPLGLGQTVGSVVTRKTYLDNPNQAAYTSWANSNFTKAPNGSLMRTYPLGIISLNRTLTETFDMATDFCLVTHADYRCVVSCCIGAAIVRNLLRGEIQNDEDIDKLVDLAADYVEAWIEQSRMEESSDINNETDNPPRIPPSLNRQELCLHTKATSYAALELDDLRKLGYVYKCLGSSILCLRSAIRLHQASRDCLGTVLTDHFVFEDLINELVMEGGDADTNAAVAGAFLGCFLGFSALPSHWYNGIKDIEWLLKKADALIQKLGIDECAVGYVGGDDPDTREDGGKGFLNQEQLKAREMAFMEIYLRKTMDKKGGQSKSDDGIGQGLLGRWKGVFG